MAKLVDARCMMVLLILVFGPPLLWIVFRIIVAAMVGEE